MDIASIPLTTIDGASASLADYDGDVLLVVNVASRCGRTPQYAKLEALQKTYADQGFTVLGFPSNQFKQELESETEIAEYCSATWGVSFPMFAKVAVNGEDRHPLYAELVQTPDEQGQAGDVQWNFEKFLITREGAVHRFRPRTEPDAPEIVSLIEVSLQHAGTPRRLNPATPFEDVAPYIHLEPGMTTAGLLARDGDERSAL